ncbi:Tn7 transposase TnsA N-terminal domain-containing protein [Rhizobium anhuiense]|uniref:Tn7 transposase TnsA N-terminal domain-containing protein n=1 Tax=Rhizobium anhuiense TaxID=1184720 RepID=UPI001FE024FF|nr:Tn7 transposase TnsA N-terminal domain-containing protein [Rhizobium anhuiense]
MVFHESELEHRVSTIIQARADVRELHSQFPVLPFADDDGVLHEHTFDFYVVFDDGYRVAIAVKHARKQAQILDMFDRIGRHDFSHVADDLRLMTEEDATYEAFYNAHDILLSREHFDEAEYQTTRSIAKRLAGRFRLGELLRGCSHLGARRDAVWQLIDDGLLIPLSSGRISDLTWLTVPS